MLQAGLLPEAPAQETVAANRPCRVTSTLWPQQEGESFTPAAPQGLQGRAPRGEAEALEIN